MPDAALTGGDPLAALEPKAGCVAAVRAAVASAREQAGFVSVLALDVDHFKSVNDAFGHNRGDQVLRELAARLLQVAGTGNTVFRYGGDEIVLLLPGAGAPQAADTAHRIMDAVCRAPFPGEPPLSISLSIGSASYPADAGEAELLLERADQHLYQAKRRGRGQVAVNAAPDGPGTPRPLSRAIERDQLLAEARRFLRSLPDSGRATLCLHGVSGAGRSRALAELQAMAGLLDYRVFALRATPALSGRAYGMFVDGDEQREAAIRSGPAEFVRELYEAVARDEQAGLLITVDDFAAADESSRELLAEILRHPSPIPAGLAWTGTRPAELDSAVTAPHRTLEVLPLTANGVRGWVRSSLQWEPPPDFARWLAEHTRGLPSYLERGLARLIELGLLHRANGGWELDGSYLHSSLRGWLQSQQGPARSNVPAPTSSILGRDAEIREAKAAIEKGRLLTLFGPGGFGKTRLGVQVLAELASEFRDGVFFVALASIEAPDQLLDAVAKGLRLTPRADTDTLALLSEHLASRELLLGLDNFEHLASAAPRVGELLARAPGLKVLATSRERLGLAGEALLHVRGMPLPEGEGEDEIRRSPAVQLFARQARQQQPGIMDEPGAWPAAAAVCRTLGGVPLAIELAAGLASVLPCHEILDEVRRNPAELRSSGRDTPARHGSLRAVFEYSWQRLSDRERLVWARLALFPGGFTREAAAEVAGASLQDLSALNDKSLLHRTTAGRFEIHEMLRPFAAEALCEDAVEHARTSGALSAFFAEQCYVCGERGRGADAEGLLARMDAEILNVQSAFEFALGEGDPERIEKFIKGLFQFYDARARFDEGAERFGRAAARLSDDRLLGLALGRQAHFVARLGDADGARELHRRSIRMLRQCGSAAETTISLYNLGMLAYQEGRYDRARTLYRRCARIYRHTGSTFGLALCHNELGTIALLQGEHEQAEHQFEQALELRTALEDHAGRARCLANLGALADMGGDPDRARVRFDASLAAARASGDIKAVASALNNLGVLAHRLGEERNAPQLLEEATGFLRQALDAYRQIGARSGIALTLYNLGDIARLEGLREEARRWFAGALEEAESAGAANLVLTVVVGVARLHMDAGNPPRAIELLTAVQADPASTGEDRETATRLLEELGAMLLAPRTSGGSCSDRASLARQVAAELGREWVAAAGHSNSAGCDEPAPPALETTADIDPQIERARFAERQAQHATARQWYEAALHSLRDPGHGVSAAPLLRWIGLTHLREGDLDAAADCFAASLATAEARAEPVNVAHALNLQGAEAFERRDSERALPLFRQAWRISRSISDDELSAIIEHNLALVHHLRGSLRRSLHECRSSLERFRRLGSDAHAIEVLNTLGLVHTDLGEWDEAAAAYDQALDLCGRLGDLNARVLVQVNLVELCLARGEAAAAMSACDDVFTLATQIDDRRALTEIHKHYGVIFRETGVMARAEVHLAEAARGAAARGDRLLRAEVAKERALLLRAQGLNQQALARLNEAYDIFLELNARHRLADLDCLVGELQDLFLAIARQWSDTIESADPYTRGHCDRVADYACTLATAAGLDTRSIFWFRLGALLHDVGKIIVPAAILNKAGSLTSAERAIIEQHPAAGAEMLDEVQFPWDIRPMVRHHHERWAGGGYPDNLIGDEIPFAARVLCIADVYDALTSDRPYRAGFTHQRALETMGTLMQGHFDPDLFELFRSCVHGPAASQAGERAA